MNERSRKNVERRRVSSSSNVNLSNLVTASPLVDYLLYFVRRPLTRKRRDAGVASTLLRDFIR